MGQLTLDWDLIQATLVVLSYEFLVLGVVVLFVRAFKKGKTQPLEEALPSTSGDHALPLLEGAAPSLIPTPTATPVALPRFLAAGTAPNLSAGGQQAASTGPLAPRKQPWDEPADWSDLTSQQPALQRPEPQRRVPLPLPGLPPERASMLRSKRRDTVDERGINRKTAVYTQRQQARRAHLALS